MRISTSQIYDTGALNIQRNQSGLYKLQNQMSSGRRVLTPADDPVAAAQALIVSQSAAVNGQHIDNQGNATSQLALIDSQLTALTGALQDARVLTVQAGGGALSTSDRASIANDLQSLLDQALGIANAQNGSGDYLFAGYQGATLPFAADATAQVDYFGDNGERLLQVSSSRQLPVNVAGSDLFMNIKEGNGHFAAKTGGNTAGGINQGSGVINAGSVLDLQQWQQAVNGFGWQVPTNPALQIRFAGAAGASTYQLYDVSNPLAPVAMSAPAAFTPGQAISIASTNPPAASATDFGSQVVITGQPAANDTFSLAPSASRSIFQTLQSLIARLRMPIGTATNSASENTNALAAELANLDQGLANVSRVQSSVGTRMRELDALGSTSTDLDLQFQDAALKLTGLDYAKAISDFTMQQMYLEAAQKSFAQVAGLSLFDIL